MNIKPIQQLIETEMDRKEFLVYLGACFLAITGVAGIIKSLAPPEKQGGSRSGNKSGYGGSAYGG